MKYDYVCTEETPWNGSIAGLVPEKHPDLKFVKKQDEYFDIYICPHCKLTFAISKDNS